MEAITVITTYILASANAEKFARQAPPASRQILATMLALTVVTILGCNSDSSGGFGSAGATDASAPQSQEASPDDVPTAAAPPNSHDQLTVLNRESLSARLTEVTFETDSFSSPTKIRILLPEGYETDDGAAYPVLYLLHGAFDDFRSWTDKGAAEEATAGLPVIVVMPDGGQNGFYSDWYNRGEGGPPMYETYHIRQLIPWVDTNYRTIASREGRAIAGLSMGGFGTLSYAARHPHLFVAAVSLSGAVDTNVAPLDGSQQALQDNKIPGDTWGQRALEEVRWRAHNPWDLAANLNGLKLILRTGNGLPGGPYGGGDPVETLCWRMSTSVHERLAEFGVPHTWDDYGAGGHDWPYWQRGLRQTLPELMATFAQPPALPDPFIYVAVEPVYRVYNWTVRLQRDQLEFSRLDGASASGFTLSGSGAAEVITAPYYPPGSGHRVRVRGPYDWGEQVISANEDGRLTIHLTLGPSNQYQQYTAAAKVAGTSIHKVFVEILSAE